MTLYDDFMLTNDEGKTCRKCGKRLPLSHFYRKRKSADTYQDWCISCQRSYKVESRMKQAARRSSLMDMRFGDIVESMSGMGVSGAKGASQDSLEDA